MRPLADGFRVETDGVLDLLPLAQALLDARSAGYGAALFHATLVDALAAWAAAAACRAGVGTVAFGGGCFLNAILSAGLRARLAADGFEVIEARQAPANDGGLALGQAWVARRALSARTTRRTETAMCLAIPARVVEVLPDSEGVIDVGGVRKRISLELVTGVVPGDYVIVHVGYALQRLDPDEAARTLALFAEAGAADDRGGRMSARAT